MFEINELENVEDSYGWINIGPYESLRYVKIKNVSSAHVGWQKNSICVFPKDAKQALKNAFNLGYKQAQEDIKKSLGIKQ